MTDGRMTFTINLFFEFQQNNLGRYFDQYRPLGMLG